MRRMTSSLLIFVAACAAKGPVAVGEQLQCGVAVASGAGYSPSVPSYNRPAVSRRCVVMANANAQLTICEVVRDTTVYVTASRSGRQPTTTEMGITDRIARSCPPRPLRK